MKTQFEEYKWLASLGDKIRSGQSSIQEKNEFMDYMYAHGEIDKEQYDNYRAGRYTEKILNTTLAIGAISLLTYLLDTLFRKNNGSLISLI